MDLEEFCSTNTRKLADYFVICGLPNSPVPFDTSEVLMHTEEIIIPDVPVDFTRFQEPIVDIKIVSVRDNEEIPYGYQPIKRTYSGRFKANIKGRIGDEVYICFRRGRDKPPITDIDMFTAIASNRLMGDAELITRTCGGKNANFRSAVAQPVYLSYRRAPAESGVDRLAVTDMCIIIPSKHETCPPAFNRVAESLNSNPLVSQMYLCFRKSLIKQYIIAYDPEVLSWYRVRDPYTEFETDKQGPLAIPTSQNTLSSDKPNNVTLDEDIRQVAKFCLPWGAAIESWSVDQEPPQPNFFTFVLTNESYQRLYGVAFTFYEPYDIEQFDMDKCYRLGVDPELVDPASQSMDTSEVDANEEARIASIQKHFIAARIGDRVIGVTKAMCLLSRWSFPVAFTNFLAFLYSRWQPAAKTDCIPFERYLAYFLCEVPFPTQTMPHVMVELCAAPILLNYPEDNDAVSKCEPFFFLLDSLGVDLSIQLLVQMLTEQKILLTSVRHFLLTQIGEALTAMIFPLRWTVVYIPFVYIGCVHVVQSPSPYLIGVDSRFFDFFRLPPGGGVTYVDLDTRNFKLPETSSPGQPVLDAKMLPKKPMKQLKNTLTKLFTRIKALRPSRARQTTNILFRSMFSQAGSELANNELVILERRQQWLREFAEMATIGLHVKNAFMHFMAQLLKDYRRFLIPVQQAERDILFNTQGFLKDASEKHSRPFYQALFETQQWANFVRDRSYVSTRDEELSQFDSYMARVFGGASPLGSETPSDSPSSSVRGFGDGGSDVHSYSGPSDSTEMSEEPYILKMLSSGSISNEAVHVVGPPKWPIAGIESCLLSEPRNETESKGHTKLVSVSLNERLLELIVSQIYREQVSATAIEFGGLNVSENGQILFRSPFTSNQLVSSHNLLFSARYLNGTSKPDLAGPVNDPLLISLMTSDSSSPFNTRSALSTSLSLAGLPTQYPLPVGGSVILRRTPFELHQTAEFVKRASVDFGLAWAHHLVSSMYSLWFMLLPSYLASIYSSMTKQYPPTNSDRGLNALNSALQDAVHLAYRLLRHNVVCPDQVMLRIVLVLVYQHRPPGVELSSLLDPEQWNSSSIGLVNLIFKTLEKECQEKQRLEFERSRVRVDHVHRRSASLTCGPGESLQESHENSQLEGFKQVHGMPHSSSTAASDYADQKDTRSHQSGLLLTHRRSSSSTATSLTTPVANTVAQKKSETDSGLLIGTMGDDSALDDGVNRSNHSVLPNITDLKENSTYNILTKPLEQLSVSGKIAPLASVNEIDLGYSTLNRQKDANPSMLLSNEVTLISDIKEVSLRHSDGPTRSVQAATMEQPLEAVQKPPLDTVKQPAQPVVWNGRHVDRTVDGTNHTALDNRLDAFDDEAEDNSDGISASHRPQFDLANYFRAVSDSSTRQEIPTTHAPLNVSLQHQRHQEHFYTDSSNTTKSAAIPDNYAQNPKPRGSLDYLNNALSIFGKSTSDLLSRFNIPVRDWLGAGTPSTPIADYAPWNGRRATTAGLSTPSSTRIARRVIGQRMFDDDDEDHDTYFREGHHQTASSPDFWSFKTTETDMDSQGIPQLHRLTNIAGYSNYWSTVAGAMANGKPNQRSFPATLATLRRNQPISTLCCSRVSASPLPLRVPIRSSSMEPSTIHSSTTGPSQKNSIAPNASLGLQSDVPGAQPRESSLDQLDTSKSENLSTSDTPIASDCSPSPSSGRLIAHSSDHSQTVINQVCRLNVIMTTCSTCPSCTRFVHDEEIMAAWSPDENEYNIPCPFCSANFVPQITVRILGDVYNPTATVPAPESRDETTSPSVPGSAPTRRRGSTSSSSHRRMSPFTSRGLLEFSQHYLSPFVLRKALETVIQHEGDESLRVQSPGHCFLYKHEQLTWSLVWYTQRIGLLTNLLDTLPAWLMDQQLKAQKRVTAMGGLGIGTRRTENGSYIPDALLQVQLSPDLPVMISLRWNSYQVARSKSNTPLYKQFLSIRDESNSPWVLVPGGLQPNPVVSAGTLGLSTSSDCPVDATIARMLNALRIHNVPQALDALIALRACILGGKPISKVLNYGSPQTDQPADASHTSKKKVLHDDPKVFSSGCRTRCTDSHRGAWCVDGSLYRELLFFTMTAVSSVSVDTLAFDEQFNSAYFNYRTNKYPYVHDTDRGPCLVATVCREMLRPLTLVP